MDFRHSIEKRSIKILFTAYLNISKLILYYLDTQWKIAFGLSVENEQVVIDACVYVENNWWLIS